jgi:hypothetical protein
VNASNDRLGSKPRSLLGARRAGIAHSTSQACNGFTID